MIPHFAHSTGLARLFGALAVAVLAASAVGAETRVVFHGGAGQVGGSCALVERDGACVMVDCGTFYGDEAGFSGRASHVGFGFDPRSVGDLVVTHAHADHAGRVPELVRAGFAGRIWMTEPTRRLSEVAWASQVQYDESAVRRWRWSSAKSHGLKVHWRPDCEWSGKIAERNLRTFDGTFRALERHLAAKEGEGVTVAACRVCSQLEVGDVMKLVRTVDFDAETRIGPFKVVLRAVKHLPGAAAVYFDDGARRFVFSGDLGTLRSRMVRDIAPAERVDAVFVECTYGDASRGVADDTAAEYARFRKTVADALAEGKVVWVPAFAMDRTQRVLLELAEMSASGELPSGTPVRSLSPSGNEMTALYAGNPAWFDAFGRMGEVPRLTGAASVRRFDGKSCRGPAVVLSTAGMMDAGRSRALIPELLPREDVAVCLVGYQGEGTPGRALRDGARALCLTNGSQRVKVDVKASVSTFDCFSGHADAAEADRWLSANRKSRIFLIHGDAEALKARKAGLESRFGASVEIVKPGRPIIP